MSWSALYQHEPAPEATLALVADAQPQRAFAWRDGQVVDVATYLGDVAALAATLPAQACAINLCEDRYRFLVAFGAALARGQTCLLPSSRAERVIEELRAAHPDSHCVHDGFALHGAVPHLTLPQIAGNQVAVIGYTSGSTGEPRPHPKQWRSFAASSALNAACIRAQLGATTAATPWIVATVPPQHMYGMETSVLLPLLGGMAVHAGKPLFPADIAAALAAVPAPRVLVSTPAHLRTILASGQEFPQLALVVSATAPLDAVLAGAVEQRLQCAVLEMFGSTETCVIASRRTAHESNWTLYPQVQLGPGPDGTRVDAPWIAAQTQLQDLVELGAGRTFQLRGRNADLVEIAGKRASLAELTRRLLAIDGVRDAVVFQHDTADAGGVRRVAALVVAPGLEPGAILAQLRLAIDPAFLPRPLRLLERLPRNEVGKLPQALLLEALRAPA